MTANPTPPASPTIPEDVRGAVERLTMFADGLGRDEFKATGLPALHVDNYGPFAEDLRVLLNAYTALVEKVGEVRADAKQNNEDANLQAQGWNACSDQLRAATARAEALETLHRHTAAAWFYGSWKAETLTERLMEGAMHASGWWPIKDESDLFSKVDAWEERQARAALPQAGGK